MSIGSHVLSAIRALPPLFVLEAKWRKFEAYTRERNRIITLTRERRRQSKPNIKTRKCPTSQNGKLNDSRNPGSEESSRRLDFSTDREKFFCASADDLVAREIPEARQRM